jgi:uncharacterized protein
MSRRQPLVVVAFSARPLAVSAARAGYAPLAIDMFGDLDTRAAGAATVAVEGRAPGGLNPAALMRALDSLIRDYHPIGLVYGSAFDDQPDIVVSLGGRTRVFGNSAETVRESKDPLRLAALCESLGVSHPEVTTTAPNSPAGWLAKLRGGAGGAHVHAARSGENLKGDWYFQRHVAGRSVSVLFLADGAKAELVGFSEQWTAPTAGALFRYGGAAGPIALDPAAAQLMLRAVKGLTGALGLRGLNSADFLVSDENAHLVDLNPRPGATLDIFDRIDDPLVARHIAACEGHAAPHGGAALARAAEIVYARSPLVIRTDPDWPDWIADRSPPGTPIGEGDPLCTVLAEAADVETARRLLAERATAAVALLGEKES